MKRSAVLGVAMALAVVGSHSDARAQSLDVNSSMGAVCIGSDCSTVSFTLDLLGAGDGTYVKHFQITSSDMTLWQFGALVAIYDAAGNDVTANWIAGVTGDKLDLIAAGSPPAEEPLRIVVAMSTYGTQSQLTNGSLTYSGQGCVDPTTGTSCNQTITSFGGTVTPEPASMLLLATGILGFGVVFRRRILQAEGALA